MTYDAVVVGGGIAGLTAAWRLRHRDVLLLEAGDRLGGRIRSDATGDYWLNHGAHLFPAPGSTVDGLVRECGLDTVPVRGGMLGLAIGSRVLDGGRVETYPLRLPLPLPDRIAFARAGLKVKRAVAGRALDAGEERTFGEFLGPLPPAAEGIFSCAAHRATAELTELSTACGIALFALVWGGKGSLIARNLPGGPGLLPSALGAGLGERARTGCRVHAIREEQGRLVVEHDGGEASARHVIVAAQAPYAASLVSRVSDGAAAALSQLTYGAFLTVAVETNERGPMPYDAVYAMATPGRAFDMLTNQAGVLRGAGGERRPGGSLMLYAGGHHAAALMREGDDAIVARFLGDLHELYPQTRGIVARAFVRRWELGNVFERPGHSRLKASLAGALGPDRNVHLAADYFAPLGNIEAAAQAGAAAATQVDTQLTEVSYA